MDCLLIMIQEDGSCLQCGEEMAKGDTAYTDKMAGTMFCSELHWAAYYDIDDAAKQYKEEMADGEPLDE